MATKKERIFFIGVASLGDKLSTFLLEVLLPKKLDEKPKAVLSFGNYRPTIKQFEIDLEQKTATILLGKWDRKYEFTEQDGDWWIGTSQLGRVQMAQLSKSAVKKLQKKRRGT